MGGKRPKRTRRATGILEDVYGFGVFVRKKEHRYPLGTPLEQLQKERRRLLEEAGPPTQRRGTLRADCDDHLKTIPEGRAREEQRAICLHWCEAFGDDTATLSVTAKGIKQHRAAWAKRFSEKHLNNMLHVLRAVFKTNYPKEPSPAADVPVFTVKYQDARAIPDALVDLIINGMSDTRWPATKKNPHPPPNLAKLRFRVMRETGFNQAMVKRVQPHHLNLKAKTVYTQVRRKGRGVEAATIDLTDAAVKAWRALVRAGGLGPFNTRSLAYCWRRAVDRAKGRWEAQEAKKQRPGAWPLSDDVRAYDLRHTFGTSAILSTDGELEAVATLMRHANLNTTRRYLQAASQIRARMAVKKMNRSGFRRLP